MELWNCGNEAVLCLLCLDSLVVMMWTTAVGAKPQSDRYCREAMQASSPVQAVCLTPSETHAVLLSCFPQLFANRLIPPSHVACLPTCLLLFPSGLRLLADHPAGLSRLGRVHDRDANFCHLYQTLTMLHDEASDTRLWSLRPSSLLSDDA